MAEWLVFGVAVMLWLTASVDLAILWVLMAQLSAIPSADIAYAAAILTAFGFFKRLTSEVSREESVR